jgi:hypothetical protein
MLRPFFVEVRPMEDRCPYIIADGTGKRANDFFSLNASRLHQTA